MNLYIGIDPGKSGGIAFVNDKGQAWAYKMPDSGADILDILRDYCFTKFMTYANEYYTPFACIEKVGPMPGQGVVSMFTFGEGYGALQMALLALKIPFERVTPQTWQKALGCRTGGDKNVSKRRAQELFPDIKVTHAIADALLIAEHNRRTRTLTERSAG